MIVDTLCSLPHRGNVLPVMDRVMRLNPDDDSFLSFTPFRAEGLAAPASPGWGEGGRRGSGSIVTIFSISIIIIIIITSSSSS